MGCRQQSRERKSIENEKLEKFEDSLGFKQYDCHFFEGILSRLSSASTNTQFLDLFQKFTKISFSDPLKSQILSSFSEGNKILPRPFRIFCILLSKSSEQEKAENLWYVFDESLQDSLQNVQIKSLVSLIISASIKVSIPAAGKSGQFEEEKLKTWETYLTERVEGLENKLLKHFTQNKELVTKEEFLLRVQDRPEGLITSTSAIRNQLEHTQAIPNKFANSFKRMKVTKLTG